MTLAQLPLPYPFELGFMQRALVAGLVVGAFAPLIGTFLVLRRMSLIGDGIGHIAFAGVALGAVTGSALGAATGIYPMGTALAVAVAGALGLEQLRARRKASGDLALALFFYSGIALGIVLLSRELNPPNVLVFLFGQILTVGDTEVAAIVILAVVVGGAILAIRRTLFAVVADEEWARVAGLPVGLMNNLLAVTTAITVVASMRVVGILLVAGLMVLPVASAQLLARSFRGTMIWATSIGVGSVVIGLIASRVWNLASGGMIVLVAAGTFVVVAIASPGRSRWRFLGGAERGAAPPIAAAGRGDGILADSHFADRLGGDGQ
jgi:zinc transport system permease protein